MKLGKLFSLTIASGVLAFASNALALDVGDATSCVDLVQVMPDGTQYEGCIRDTIEPTQKFTMLEFFSTTCGYCVENYPTLAKLADEISPTVATRLVAIDRTESRIHDYIAANRAAIKVPVVIDSARMATKAFGVVATPTLFILDKAKVIVYKHEGTLGDQELAEIKELVK